MTTLTLAEKIAIATLVVAMITAYATLPPTIKAGHRRFARLILAAVACWLAFILWGSSERKSQAPQVNDTSTTIAETTRPPVTTTTYVAPPEREAARGKHGAPTNTTDSVAVETTLRPP
jgi:hypothetical protein